jgi:adenylate cyclase
MRLDPLDPSRAGTWAGLACAHNALGDFKNGYDWSLKAVESVPEVWTLAYLVINAVPLGLMKEAHAAVQRILELRPAFNLTAARDVCQTRDKEWSDKMMESFRSVGLH